MEFEHLVSQMVHNAQRIRALAEGVSDHQARWKPTPASWSILEVVNHLLDEEKEDFIGRRGLLSPNWDTAYDAPFGRITAGDMFAAWVAHDLVHMRQLVELHWACTVMQAEPYGVRYAGTW